MLPPIARLTPAQAMYHFLSGYTAKVAGTERGVTEPGATFSTCFGAPFLPLHPTVYATMLGERLARHGAKVWLVNTGWTGGPYGEGQRMKLGLHAAYGVGRPGGGARRHADGIAIRSSGSPCRPGSKEFPTSLLLPRATWKDPASYDAKARKVAAMFAENFKQFEGTAAPEVRAAGPRIG